ncbi:FAD binding domain-containing protein [Gordonia malaquae]|uniref:FAD-dependent oxidoreductase 2 FAD-binding domain-containing protein n=1 Tax=Gordonia malaquae NBRC 108250 TaxID=1223542 RepID=M3TER1_GORML|nr:hypothetical protein GM1_013_00520 [Gordonia malaquae NBRC 108250]SEB80705.1 FAD binding domain-containing protein [Gordonia malaquae]
MKTEYDVIVVGSGAGGLTAALAAADRGLSTLIIEKADVYGGSTALSGGGVWIPNSPQLERIGIVDSRESVRGYRGTQRTVRPVPRGQRDDTRRLPGIR